EPDQSRAGPYLSNKMQAPCAPNSDRSRCRSAGSDDQEALPCRDQTRKRIALVHPLAAPSWTAPANHLSIRRNHGSPMVSTRVLQHGVIPGSCHTKAQGISSPGRHEAILMWPRNDGELRWNIMSDWTCR